MGRSDDACLSKTMFAGRFFVFDGMDGAGKTTQLKLLGEWLDELGNDVLSLSDPGSTDLGTRMRELLLGHHEIAIGQRSELLMFLTARAQLVEELIRPALASGKTVLCDRYIYSTVVYQGHAADIDPDVVWRMNLFAVDGLLPDLTFLFEVDAETAARRLGATLDRMESRGPEFYERLRRGFIAESERNSDGVLLIDGTQPKYEIHENLKKACVKVVSA